MFPSSLRSKLMLLLTPMLGVLLLASFLRTQEHMRQDTAKFIKDMENRADLIRANQNDSWMRHEQMLSFISTVMNPGALMRDRGCAAKLGMLTDRARHLSNITLLDRKGHVACSAHPLPPWLEAETARQFAAAWATAGRIVFAPVRSDTTQTVILATGQRYMDSAGQPAGVAIVTLNMDWLSEQLAKLGPATTQRIGLITSTGMLLARHPDPDRLQGQDISRTELFAAMQSVHGHGVIASPSLLEGIRRVYVFRPLLNTQGGTVHLYISIPEAETQAAARRSFHRDVLLSTAMLLLVSGVAWTGIFRLVVRPLERIADAAHLLRAGVSDARTGLPHADDEIGRLALAFDGMADQLTSIDALTGLLNARSFCERLDQALSDAAGQGRRYAVVRLNVDNFRVVEGRHGLNGAHALLRHLARQLRNRVGEQALVARLTESSFLIGTPHHPDALSASDFVDSLQRALTDQPFEFEEDATALQLSFGASLFPGDGTNAQTLLQNCSIALGTAAEEPDNHLRFFQHDMNVRLLERHRRLRELRMALEREEFVLHYQPKVELATGTIVGVEALVRWQHPGEGLLPPSAFIELAEQHGLIVPLGTWVLRRALRQLDAWRRSSPSTRGLTVAVNVCGLQLASESFLDTLRSALGEVDLPASALELELTESQLMTFAKDPEQLIQRIKALGVRIAIDDFGTGYSSLSYLKRFEIDALKIDKSFIDGVPDDPGDRVIVQATIAMAHQLGLRLVAEGVEHPQQLAYLQEQGCDQVQGYLLCRPIPPERIPGLSLSAAVQAQLRPPTA